jgi:hypothetical protein
MQINQVAPSSGYTWIRQGFWLFKQNPFTFLMLVFLYMFIVQISMFIPIVGLMLVLIFSPTLSMGFLTACQKVIRREVVRPSVYFTAFKEYPSSTRTRLIQLGSIYTLLVVILSAISSQFINLEKIMPLLTQGNLSSPEVVKEMYAAMLIAAVLYLPIAILMWFSPQLIAWKNMGVAKSIFGSWMGVWLNKGAFFVYFSTWAIILVATPMFLGAVFDSLGISDYASYLITPFSLSAISVFYCSFFATWKSCFVDSN